MINKDGDLTTQFKLATGTKTLVSHLRVLFRPCIVRKDTAHVDKKALNMRHQTQNGFRGIVVVIPQHQKGHLVYITSTRKIISSYDIVFENTSQPYSEATAMRPAVSCIPCPVSSKRKTDYIIMFIQFEEVNLLSGTCDNVERGDKSNDISIMLPPISEEEMGSMESGNESDDETISTEMLKDICDRSQSHSIINWREARYKICDCIIQRNLERKGALKAPRNIGKGLHKLVKTVVK